MDNIILTPPVAFIIILGVTIGFTSLISRLSCKQKAPTKEMEKSYACGEDMPTNMAQPDYSQFFPFAFFFTILHVFALMIATVPIQTMGSFAIAVIYILGAITGMSILFRR